MKHRKSGWVNGGEIVRLAMPNEVGEESTANETGANVVAVPLHQQHRLRASFREKSGPQFGTLFSCSSLS